LTSINSSLCVNCRTLTSIAIPSGVTNIGNLAFAASGLTQVLLPAGLTHLGDSAFANTPLTSLIVPDQLTEIGSDAFSSCNYLQSVKFGASVTNIGFDAFGYDRYLSQVIFDDNLTSISSNAFYYCQGLYQLVFPASLTSLGANSFYGVYAQFISFLGNAPATDGQIFTYGTVYYDSETTGWDAGFDGRPTVDYNSQFSFAENADGTLTIVGCDFSDGDLRLPAQNGGQLVTGIASGAFAYPSFNSITIPAALTNIPADAFAQCEVVNYIVAAGNPACLSVNGSLYDTTQTTLLGPADQPSFYLAATVTNLLANAFESCYNNLTNISVDAANPLFSSVAGVLFDKPMTTLLFYPPAIPASSYSVPESVTTIGTSAFAGTSLAAIRIPAGVTNLQPYALAYTGLRGIYFEGVAPEFDPTAFSDNYHAILFYSPSASADDFAAAGLPVQSWLSLFNWATNDENSIAIVGYNDPGNENYVLFPNAGIGGLPITDLGTSFSESDLNGITLPEEVTNIADGAFYDCGLSSVVMTTNVSWIGNNAFNGCDLDDVSIPSSVVYIGDSAFAQNELTQVVLPASVQIVGNNAFSENELTDLSLTNGLMSIGNYAFANNELQQVYLPNSLANIGCGAFTQNSLTTVVIPTAITDLKNKTFEDNSLESVSLPVGLLNIGAEAFDDNRIQTVIIPEGVTNIGSSAFADNNVQILQLPNSLITIGDSAFSDDSLQSLVIPASVASIGDSAFADNNIGTAYFLGDAPTNDDGTALSDNYPDDGSTMAYYLAGTAGWGANYGGVMTVMLSQPALGAINADNTVTLTNYIGGGSIVVPTTVGGRSVTVIGTGTFATGGSTINSITLQTGITGISFGAFAGCPALTTIVIPDTVSNIDIDAFAGCPGLTNIIVSPDNPYFSAVGGVLFDKDQTTLLACGGGETGNYVIPATVTAIGSDAFMGCSGLTNIVFPAGLTCIGDPAFAYCDNLTTLTIPATVTNLGAYSFAFCTQLTTVYFDGNAPPDDGTVFVGDPGLTVYYRPSASGFGATFGGAPTKVLKAPMAAPFTVYHTVSGAVPISIADLAVHWTDPNQSYPVTFGFVAGVSTNLAPVSSNSGTILYTSTNNVPDKITYTLVDGRGMTGIGIINVMPVNSPPTLDTITNVTFLENWQPQVVNLSGITPGPANDSAQTVTITATSSNPSLILNPTVNYSNPDITGTLTLTPATTNVFGTSTITVIVRDNGGTDNGGVDSVTNTFLVSLQGLTNYWYPNGNLTVNVSDATNIGGVSQTNYSGVLDVLADSTNPFTIKLNSLAGGVPGPAANFNNASNYIWTIATTTRGVINLASNQFIVDTTGFTNDLAGGYFSVASSPDGQSVLLVYTGNLPPVANAVSFTRAVNTSLKILISDLLTNNTSDPNGDSRVFIATGPGTNNSYISHTGQYIFYIATNNVSESFTYTILDNRPYRTNDTIYYQTNWITINVSNPVGYSQTIAVAPGGGMIIHFAGIPNSAYDVQRSTNLVDWDTLLMTNAPRNGLFSFTDSNPPQPSAYYRTRQH
jgi:hypothetical protein